MTDGVASPGRWGGVVSDGRVLVVGLIGVLLGYSCLYDVFLLGIFLFLLSVDASDVLVEVVAAVFGVIFFFVRARWGVVEGWACG